MSRYAVPVLVIALVMFCAGCAAGDMRFDESPAGFFAGLWHGIILVIAFVVSLFSDTVQIYEPNNSGSLYDLGFVLGVTGALGGGCSVKKTKKKKPDTDKVEAKVKAGIRAWIDESGESDGETGRTDDEWAEIGRKVEAKIKRELKNWAEE